MVWTLSGHSLLPRLLQPLQPGYAPLAMAEETNSTNGTVVALRHSKKDSELNSPDTKQAEPDPDLEFATVDQISTSISILESSETYASDADNPYFVRNLQYTKHEEAEVVRILDTRLFPWILLTTFVLNMDRTNNSNAISDNLPEDLGFNINVVNTATAIYSVLFSIFCLSGAVIAKIAGPSRCD